MKRIEKQVRQALPEPKGFWELAEAQDFTARELVSALNEMQEKGIVEITDKIRLNGTAPRLDPEAIEKWKQAVGERLPGKNEFYQDAISPESVAAKLEFMHKRGDLLESRILVVGDDDFFGAALAFTCLPKEVVAIDIDKRIVEKTNELAKRHGLALKAEVADVSKPLAPHLSGFDCFVMEPPEALKGHLAFVSRGASALKENGAGYTTITNVESSLKKWYGLEKALHEMGFAVTDLVRDVSHYVDREEGEGKYAGYKWLGEANFQVGIPKRGGHWYDAHLVRVELVGSASPLYPGEVRLDDSFFIDDESCAISKEMRGSE